MKIAESNKSIPARILGLKTDILPSIVVFLVALPLCMGIAIASGAPVAAGLITGIIGGLIVGALSGAPLQVSGPAAGLTVIVYQIIKDHGLETLGIVVLLAGVLQLAAGLFRIGQWFRAVSPAVIQGMLAGIGILILSSQIHVMVDDLPRGSGLQNLLTIPQAVSKGLPIPEGSSRHDRRLQTSLLKQFGTLHEKQVQVHEFVSEIVPEGVDETKFHQAAKLTDLVGAQREIAQQLEGIVATLGSEVFSEERARAIESTAHAALDQCNIALTALRVADVATARESQAKAENQLSAVLGQLKNHDWAAKIGIFTIALLLLWQAFAPKPLKLIPAPLVAVLLATVVAASSYLPVLYVEIPDNMWEELHFPSLTVVQSTPIGTLLQLGLIIAVIASAETLLCATAVDQMHHGPRTNYDRELAAQGVGNILCGFLGALPMTGVIVRSAANVQAGAKTRLSAVLHGVWLLLFVSVLAFLMRAIPTAALAAILVYTGYKLVNPKSIKKLWQYGWGEVIVYAGTVVTIVAVDLLTGVLVGFGLSVAKLLYTFTHLKTKLVIDETLGTAALSLQGAATFLRLPHLAADLERVPQNAELHVDFEHLDYVDHACLDLLMGWAKQHEATGGRLVIDWESLHANFRQEMTSRPAVTRQDVA